MGNWGCPKCISFWFVVLFAAVIMLGIHWFYGVMGGTQNGATG